MKKNVGTRKYVNVENLSEELMFVLRNYVPFFQKNYCSYNLCRENATFLCYCFRKLWLDFYVWKWRILIDPIWDKSLKKRKAIDHERIHSFKEGWLHGLRSRSIFDTCVFQVKDYVATQVEPKMLQESFWIDDYVMYRNYYENIQYSFFWPVEEWEYQNRLTIPIGEFGNVKPVPEIYDEAVRHCNM